MTLAEVPIPEPGPGQVRIRNSAAALNFFDLLQVQGKYQIKPPFPFIPGAECAGVVDRVTDAVDSLKPGDRVAAITFGGAFSEYSIAARDRVFAIPPAMDFAAAAAMPIVYHTSYYALQRAQVKAGEWLLVHAGASGVGMSAIQIGRAMGARVIATAGSPGKLAFSREQGAEHAIDYRDPSWFSQVLEITGGGANIIYDPVGSEVFDLSTKCIASEGRLLVIGFAGGRIPSIAANRILLKNISVVGVLWGGYVEKHPEFLSQTHEALMRMYCAGEIQPVVGNTYALPDAPRGLRDLAERKVLGKAVLAISPAGSTKPTI